jgi:DNA-binding MarR family transcriptional regulator
MEQLDVVGLLKAIHALERNTNIALMYSGLRVPQFRLLNALDEAGQVTVTEMSKALNITRATASVMINDMIHSGSVVVVENPSDRRSFYVRLTEHGLFRLQTARGDLGVLISKLSKRYPAETIQILNEFSRMISFGPETDKTKRYSV